MQKYFEKKVIRVTAFIITALCLIFLFGKNLNIFDSHMFEFHDASQPARIQQFALNLKTLHIPPRIAPDFSFGMGMPVFNYYAPTAYWITTTIHLIGFSIIDALKLSFMLAILGSFIFSFLFIKQYFKWYESLLGAVIYSSSLYIAMDIFVRGNLAEIWFIALFPLVLYMLTINAKKYSYIHFIVTTIIISLFLTCHNILSLIAIPMLLIFIAFLPEKKRNFLAFFTGFLLSAYYFIPLIGESFWVQAKQIASQTDYRLHFLCPNQLWNSPWGFGGSAPGCVSDGLSFKLGKPQIIGFILGLIVLLWNLYKRKKSLTLYLGGFFVVLTLISLFMTTYASSFIWNMFSPILSIVQFPWRFISFSLIGIAFISSYAMSSIKIQFKELFILLIILATLVINSKYFYGHEITNKNFNNHYLSQKYISEEAGYLVPEYISTHTDQTLWKNLKTDKTKLLNSESSIIIDTGFFKQYLLVSDRAVLPIYYFPFWEIKIDNKKYYPRLFDTLGRPIIEHNQNKFVSVEYKETPMERLGDAISIVIFILLIVGKYPLWIRSKNKSKKK